VIDDIRAARDAALAEVDTADTLDAIRALDARLLGKSGPLAAFKKQLGSLAERRREEGRRPGRQRGDAGRHRRARAREAELGEAALAARVAAERLDLTEFVTAPTRGHAHLVTQAWERLEDVFIGLGFQIAEGPEVETDWHNFEALNMGEGHPARGEFDTLFVDYGPPGGQRGRTVLRTHTSPVQIRTMLTQEPPIYIVAPGRVFRRDTPDATHMPVFHQIEGLVIDRDITLADLAGTIEAFTHAFFGPGFSSRLRPATSRSPSRRPSSTSNGPTGRGSSSAAAAWCTRTCCGRRARPRGMERLRVRVRHRPHGRAAPRDRGPPRHVRRRHPLHRAVLSRRYVTMKVLLSWLNEYGDFADPDDDAAVQRLADTMTALGLEVDGIDRVGGTVDGVVTARVLRLEQHPDAAKVQRVYVDAGDGASVTCGAGRSTWPRATSSRSRPSAPRCRTA
jgi:phenylalanyl-tRNA synthetase alpha chain